MVSFGTVASVSVLTFVSSIPLIKAVHWKHEQVLRSVFPNPFLRLASQPRQIEIDCTPPVYNPDHLDLWQVSKNVSMVEIANEHNRKFLPTDLTIHTLSDGPDFDQRMQDLSNRLEKCAGISGVYRAYKDLRPTTARSNIFRAAQLWDRGGLYMDDKIFLTDHFENFVNVSVDTVVLPKFLIGSDGYVVAGMNKALDKRVIQNAIMWSKPRHPVWEHIIRKQVKNVQDHIYGFTPYDITG
jgi:hypothetical protein